MPSTDVRSSASSGSTQCWTTSIPRIRRHDRGPTTSGGGRRAEPVDAGGGRQPPEGAPRSRTAQRGDHQPLLPRRRCCADREHTRTRLVEHREGDERSDLAGREPDGGSLTSCEGPVLRGCELSNGAHGVVASHSGRQSYRPAASIHRQREVPTNRARFGLSRRHFGRTDRSARWTATSPGLPTRRGGGARRRSSCRRRGRGARSSCPGT